MYIPLSYVKVFFRSKGREYGMVGKKNTTFKGIQLIANNIRIKREIALGPIKRVIKYKQSNGSKHKSTDDYKPYKSRKWQNTNLDFIRCIKLVWFQDI